MQRMRLVPVRIPPVGGEAYPYEALLLCSDECPSRAWFSSGFLALSSQDSFSEEPSEELSGSSGDLLGGPRIPTYLTGVGINFANEIPSAFASRSAPPPPPPDLNVESKP